MQSVCTNEKREVGGKCDFGKKEAASLSVLQKVEKLITFRKMESSSGKMDTECEGQVEGYLLCFVLRW